MVVLRMHKRGKTPVCVYQSVNRRERERAGTGPTLSAMVHSKWLELENDTTRVAEMVLRLAGEAGSHVVELGNADRNVLAGVHVQTAAKSVSERVVATTEVVRRQVRRTEQCTRKRSRFAHGGAERRTEHVAVELNVGLINGLVVTAEIGGDAEILCEVTVKSCVPSVEVLAVDAGAEINARPLITAEHLCFGFVLRHRSEAARQDQNRDKEKFTQVTPPGVWIATPSNTLRSKKVITVLSTVTGKIAR